MHSKTYRYPYIYRREVQEQIKNMLQPGIFRPSTLEWSTPIWIVPKKTDASGKVKWRLVVDFWKLNEKIQDDKYPSPNITDILDKLGRCQYFTTLDLVSEFYLVEMGPGWHSQNITLKSVADDNGHFEFLRIAKGLKNSPSTFQRVMDNILRGLSRRYSGIFNTVIGTHF